MARNVLLLVFLTASAWAADTASVTTALPGTQPAGCAVNRWMPFWVDVKGSFSFDGGSGCDGFDLWLEYNPAQIEPDLDLDGLGDAYTYTGTVFDGLWTPDFTGITKETRTTHQFLHIGVTFDTQGTSDQVLATPQTDVVLLKLQFHALDYSGSTSLTIWSDPAEEWYSYLVKHPASSSQAPAAVGVTGSTQVITLANSPLFIRGNATGTAVPGPLYDPLPAPLADPKSEIDLNDGLRVLRYLFVSAAEHPIACLEAADANNDVKVNLLDAVYIFQYVFGNAAPFPEPLEHVGTDTDGDAVGCATSQL